MINKRIENNKKQIRNQQSSLFWRGNQTTRTQRRQVNKTNQSEVVGEKIEKSRFSYLQSSCYCLCCCSTSLHPHLSFEHSLLLVLLLNYYLCNNNYWLFDGGGVGERHNVCLGSSLKAKKQRWQRMKTRKAGKECVCLCFLIISIVVLNNLNVIIIENCN